MEEVKRDQTSNEEGKRQAGLLSHPSSDQQNDLNELEYNKDVSPRSGEEEKEVEEVKKEPEMEQNTASTSPAATLTNTTPSTTTAVPSLPPSKTSSSKLRTRKSSTGPPPSTNNNPTAFSLKPSPMTTINGAEGSFAQKVRRFHRRATALALFRRTQQDQTSPQPQENPSNLKGSASSSSPRLRASASLRQLLNFDHSNSSSPSSSASSSALSGSQPGFLRASSPRSASEQKSGLRPQTPRTRARRGTSLDSPLEASPLAGLSEASILLLSSGGGTDEVNHSLLEELESKVMKATATTSKRREEQVQTTKLQQRPRRNSKAGLLDKGGEKNAASPQAAKRVRCRIDIGTASIVQEVSYVSPSSFTSSSSSHSSSPKSSSKSKKHNKAASPRPLPRRRRGRSASSGSSASSPTLSSSSSSSASSSSSFILFSAPSSTSSSCSTLPVWSGEGGGTGTGTGTGTGSTTTNNSSSSSPTRSAFNSTKSSKSSHGKSKSKSKRKKAERERKKQQQKKSKKKAGKRREVAGEEAESESEEEDEYYEHEEAELDESEERRRRKSSEREGGEASASSSTPLFVSQKKRRSPREHRKQQLKEMRKHHSAKTLRRSAVSSPRLEFAAGGAQHQSTFELFSFSPRGNEKEATKRMFLEHMALCRPLFDDLTLPFLATQPYLKGESPSARYHHTATLVASRYLYIFGGTSGTSMKNSLHILDLASQTWFQAEAKGKVPSHRCGHTATLWKEERIYIIGGRNKNSFFDDVHSFDIQTQTWREVEVQAGPRPCKRCSHTASLLGNAIYVYGGEDQEGHTLSDVWALDLATFRWHAQPPSKYAISRCLHTANTIEALDATKLSSSSSSSSSPSTSSFPCVLIFGGWADDFKLSTFKRFLRDLTIGSFGASSVQPELTHWTRLRTKALPARLSNHAAVLYGSNLVLIGGMKKDKSPTNEVRVLDLVSMHWHVSQPRPSTRRLKASANGINSSIHDSSSSFSSATSSPAFASSAASSAYSSSSAASDASSASSSSFFPALCGHTASLCGDKILIFGGRDKDNKPLNKLYVLHLKRDDKQNQQHQQQPNEQHHQQQENNSGLAPLPSFFSVDEEEEGEGLTDECLLSPQHAAFYGLSESNISLEELLHLTRHIPYQEITVGDSVAHGATGVVHKGTWGGRLVAVKKFFSSEAREFRQEVKIFSRLDNPYIVKFIGACVDPEQPCIITEYLPMGNLFNFLHKSTSALDWELIVSVAMCLGRAIDYLHTNGIIHRDLKSQNILVASLNPEDVTVKLLDFGDSRQVSSNMTKSNIGTPRWAAPEISLNRPYTEKADIYSFGIILWELITRQKPFAHIAFDYQVIEEIRKGGRPKIPEDTPLAYKLLIESCWMEEPEKRTPIRKALKILEEFNAQRSWARERIKQDRIQRGIIAAARGNYNANNSESGRERVIVPPLSLKEKEEVKAEEAHETEAKEQGTEDIVEDKEKEKEKEAEDEIRLRAPSAFAKVNETNEPSQQQQQQSEMLARMGEMERLLALYRETYRTPRQRSSSAPWVPPHLMMNHLHPPSQPTAGSNVYATTTTITTTDTRRKTMPSDADEPNDSHPPRFGSITSVARRASEGMGTPPSFLHCVNSPSTSSTTSASKEETAISSPSSASAKTTLKKVVKKMSFPLSGSDSGALVIGKRKNKNKSPTKRQQQDQTKRAESTTIAATTATTMKLEPIKEENKNEETLHQSIFMMMNGRQALTRGEEEDEKEAEEREEEEWKVVMQRLAAWPGQERDFWRQHWREQRAQIRSLTNERNQLLRPKNNDCSPNINGRSVLPNTSLQHTSSPNGNDSLTMSRQENEEQQQENAEKEDEEDEEPDAEAIRELKGRLDAKLWKQEREWRKARRRQEVARKQMFRQSLALWKGYSGQGFGAYVTEPATFPSLAASPRGPPPSTNNSRRPSTAE
ncbi:protein kinase [Balamuthia mandrillaris]